MLIPEGAVNLIKKWEGFSKTPYRCPAGVPTIGYGTTVYCGSIVVDMEDPPISEEQALDFLRYDIAVCASKIPKEIRDKLNENQLSAVISLMYNIGAMRFLNSTLYKYLCQNPNDPRIREEFPKWKLSKGKVIQGLLNRRKEEAALYFKPVNIS